jgi:predicted DNA-binding transcriptional regulator YafY
MRTVEPHHMVNYMGNWHLIAYCHLRGAWRDFMLGRMTLTQVAGVAFEFRPSEEWRPYLENSFGIFQNREIFNVVLRFTPERSRWVKGELWHEGQGEVIEADGSLVLTVPVSHEAEILMEILKHGSQVEVCEPGWLRENVVSEMERAVVNYRGEGCGPSSGTML